MSILSFRGLLVVACVGAGALWLKPWDRAGAIGDGAVVGKALDAEGRPVAGASVVLRDVQGVVVGRGESNGEGVFEFADCKPGRYRLAVVKLGVGGGERSVSVDPHERADATTPLVENLTAAPHR